MLYSAPGAQAWSWFCTGGCECLKTCYGMKIGPLFADIGMFN